MGRRDDPTEFVGWAERLKVGDGQQMAPLADQLTMFDAGPAKPKGKARKPKPPPLDERYRAWLGDNAATFALFERFAWELRRAGRTRIGGKAIAERIRWEADVKRVGEGDEFKVPNAYVSRMVRTLIERDPSWRSYFTMKRLKA